MDKKERHSKLTQKLAALKLKQERELYDKLAEEYSEELVDKDSIRILDPCKSDEMYTEFSSFFTFDFSGTDRIIWSQMRETFHVKNTNELLHIIKHHHFEGSQVYLIKKFSIGRNSPPVIGTLIENVSASLEVLKNEEQFVFCPAKGYVIDIPFSGIVTLGIK